MSARCGALRRSRAARLLAYSTAGALLAVAQPAEARSRGIVVDTCTACHGGGVAAPPVLNLSADPESFEPGDSVTFTLTIEEPSIRVGGTFISSSVGTFEALPDEGLAVGAQGMTHTEPRPAQDGVVTFRFSWRAPQEPGGVNFWVLALAANGDNSVTNDVPGSGTFPWAFGCPGQKLYGDFDRDGYGSEGLGVLLVCEGEPVPEGYATMGGDCNENDETVNPGAAEICNRKDDDCNGEIDENAPAVLMWPDEDGDGYYQSRAADSVTGCGNIPGYAPISGDCDDRDPEVNPGVTETCNSKDDDCDGEVDNGVRPQCGVGWCARYSTSCDAADCEPGPPTVETCNGFDDDCDGVADNDACPEGMTCLDRECVADGIEPITSDGNSGAGGSPSQIDPASPVAASAGGVGGAPDPVVASDASDGASSPQSASPATEGAVPATDPNVAVGASPPISSNPVIQDTPATRSDSEGGCAIAASTRAGTALDCADWVTALLGWLWFGRRRRRSLA